MADSAVLIVSHGSALSYWLHAGSSSFSTKPARGNPLTRCARDAATMRSLMSDFPGFGPRPLHVLVRDRNDVRISCDFVAHLASVPLPPKSFFRLSDTLYITGPELSLLHASRAMPPAALVAAATNIAASYYLHPVTGAIEQRTAPVASRRSIAAYAEAAAKNNVRGAMALQRATPFVLDGARSPMETRTALLLSLPRTWGGYGLGLPQLNFDVHPGRNSQLAEQGSFCIDIAYPNARVGVEYFGEEFHQDAFADRARENGLRSLGWDILTVDKHQLSSGDAFDTFARQLARKLGVRLQKSRGWRDKHDRLRADLDLPSW